MKTILGTKGQMNAAFDSRGQRVPTTTIFASQNVVLDVKENKVVLGAGAKKKVKKTENTFVNRIGFAPRHIREAVHESEVKTGDKISVSIFSPGDEVKVTGITKGKGFAGAIKRWGFAGGPKTHGQSDRHRAPGSIGQTTTPGRVLKGKKMAGHLGSSKLTVTGLEVIEVDKDKNILIVKGAVPGAKNGFLIIEKTGRAKKYIAPSQEKPKEGQEDKEDLEGAEGKQEEDKKQSQQPQPPKPSEPEKFESAPKEQTKGEENGK